MNTRIRKSNLAKPSAPTLKTDDLSPKVEEIQQRAHEIFLARGGTPGRELEDWLRAEQELKQHRARVKTPPQGRGK